LTPGTDTLRGYISPHQLDAGSELIKDER